VTLFSPFFFGFIVYAAIGLACAAAVLLPILFLRDQRSRKIW
jgi:hypothetical protein